MVKLISILFSVLSLNFIFSFGNFQKPQTGPELNFGSPAIGIESGQPVYHAGTKVWLSNPNGESLDIQLNEREIQATEIKVDISEMENLESGTYTLVVNTKDNQSIFGFTIK